MLQIRSYSSRKAAEAHEFIQETSDGYDTVVGEDIHYLEVRGKD